MMTDLVEAFAKNSKDLVELYKSIDAKGRIHLSKVNSKNLDILQTLSHYFIDCVPRGRVRKEVFTCGITTHRRSNKTMALNEILEYAKDSNYFVHMFSSYQNGNLHTTRFLSRIFSRDPISHNMRKVRELVRGRKFDGGIILLDELSPDEPITAKLLDEIDGLIAQAGGKPILAIYAKS